MSAVIAQRCDARGRPLESIREDETVSKHFYPLTPDGPFVTKLWPSKLEYSIIAENGSLHRLKFLTTHKVYEQYLACFPISDGRWIGIAPLAKAPVENSLRVRVFNGNAELSAATVPGCERDENVAVVADRHPESLRSTFRFYAYEFDPKEEAVVFTTRNGRFIFRAGSGSLQKTQK